MKADLKSLQLLRNLLNGELYDDPLYKGIYATDASNYQVIPIAVACPKDEDDVIKILHWAREHHIPVMARGGGTSLVGQTVLDGIVIDFTPHMDSLIELNTQERWAWVQPGLVRDVLNNQIAKSGLHFAPDPATTSRATIGGMIANNSSGTRSILYGKTIDHVIEMKVLLEDGSIIHCKNLKPHELESKLEEDSKEGKIYRKLFQLVQANKEEIRNRFPKVMRRVGGYNLDEFVEDEWNLCKLFTGSECTLGIILSAKIKLEPLPSFQSLCIVHFHDFFESITHVSEIVNHAPAAVELLDQMLIERSRENIETRRYCSFIVGNPEAVLVVEFYGQSLNEVEDKAKDLAINLQNKKIGYSCPVITDREKITEVFTLRQKGLGLLMGVKGLRKPIAFIEDAAVPLQHLADYIKEVFEVCKKFEVPVVAYAHASVGLLHVKPLLDLRDAGDINLMKLISQETLQLVKKYKGSWSGEHGDGLARSPYNEEFFGTRLYNAFRELKSFMDPLSILNPGKIVDAPPVEENLRYGIKYHDTDIMTMYKFRSENGFHEAVHLCNGVGECRKMKGGSMCPSYRATKDEKDSTRGRANILRLAMSGQLDNYGLQSPVLRDVLDLCLSCKACKAECPSNVDMAKLKSEVLHYQHKKFGLQLADRLLLAQDLIAKTSSGGLSNVVNPILRSKMFRFIFEKISGMDRRRILPEYSKTRFGTVKRIPSIKDKNKTVVLFADTYMKYHEPQIGISAKTLLESLGYEVIIFDGGCCQRPAISHGLLDHAKKYGTLTLTRLEYYLQDNIPVLVCEPSCATALMDDIPDLLEDERWLKYSNQIFLLENFLVNDVENLTRIKFKRGNYLLHGHCHQKAIYSTRAMHQLFQQQEDIQFNEIDSGCCGMAGSFGYEKNHYNLSEIIARTALIPAIENSPVDTNIIASGFSCRHQVRHFSKRVAKHWVEYLSL